MKREGTLIWCTPGLHHLKKKIKRIIIRYHIFYWCKLLPNSELPEDFAFGTLLWDRGPHASHFCAPSFPSQWYFLDMYLEWIEMIYISEFDDFNYHAIRMKKCSVVKKKRSLPNMCPIWKRLGVRYGNRFTNKIMNAQ